MLTVSIQAGGQSSRMGEDKALKPFLGRPLIQRVVDRLTPIADEMIVTTNRREDYSFLHLPLVSDLKPGRGALGGLYTAIASAAHPVVAVVACDMPFISPRAAQLMWEHKKETGCCAVVPSIEGRVHPLHGIYDTGCLNKITELLHTRQYRLKDLLDRLHWKSMQEDVFLQHGIDHRFIVNMNTPREYEQALRLNMDE